MTDLNQAKSLFLAALDCPASERAAYLQSQCGGNAALRARVEAMLTEHEKSGELLPRPAAEMLGIDSATHADEFVANAVSEAETTRAEDDPLCGLAASSDPKHLGRLDHYEVLELIGKGGFGTVYRAFDTKLHRVVAIKVLTPELAVSGPARKRFIREAQTAAAIKNDHVVAIHNVEPDHQPPYIVMEYIDGMTLQGRLDKDGPLEVKEILRIGVQMAEGLAAAHRHGEIHRDIKPANILLENGVQRVKITDFGLARAINDASITQSGVIAGTPMYMSPEQADGLTLDHRSDLFSLGTVLYVMCTGRPPFRATGTIGVLKRVVEETPRSIREINSEIPQWLCDVVERLHAKKPEDRFESAREVADVLAAYLSDLQLHGSVRLALVEQASRLPGAAPMPAAAAAALPAAGATAATPWWLPAIAVWLVLGAACLLLLIFVPMTQVRLFGEVRYFGPLAMTLALLFGASGVALWLSRHKVARASWAQRSRVMLATFAPVLFFAPLFTLIWLGDFFREEYSLPPDPRLVVTVDDPDLVVEVIQRGNHPIGPIVTIPDKSKDPIAHNFAPPPGEYEIRGSKKGTVYRREFITLARGDEKARDWKSADGWVQLFNGEDLKGWTLLPDWTGDWKVERGVLHGSGKLNHLFTERDDFQDFHLRVQARINRGGDSGVFFRTRYHAEKGAPFPPGYEAQIQAETQPQYKAGGLMIKARTPLPLTGEEVVLVPDEWFTLEVTAKGDHIVIQVNGKTTMDVPDPARTYRRGRFALQAFPGTTVAFRKIEIKELPPPESGWAPLYDGTHVKKWKVTGAYDSNAGELVLKPDTWLQSLQKMPCNFHLRMEVKLVRGQGVVRFHGVPVVDEMRGPNAGWFIMMMESEKMPGRVHADMSVHVPGQRERHYHPPIGEPAKLNEWFLLEIISREMRGGLTAEVRIDGKKAMFFRNADFPLIEGVINLWNTGLNDGEIAFRKIEIKELPPPAAPLPDGPEQVLPALAGAWKGEYTQKILGGKPDVKKISAVAVNDWIVSNKWLRQRVQMGNEGFQSVTTYEPGANVFRDYLVHSRGLIVGPSTGRWDADSRTMTWTNSPEAGVILLMSLRFVDANTFASEILIRDKEGKTVFEMTSLMKRTTEKIEIDESSAAGPLPKEMAVLDRLVGDWQTSGLIKNAKNPDGLKASWQSSVRRILGGRVIATERTGYPGDDESYSLASFNTFSKAYGRWSFRANGNVMEYGGLWDEENQTLKWHWSGKDGSQSSNTWPLRDPDRRDWQVVTKDALGKTTFEVQATSVRRKGPGAPPPLAVAPFDAAKAREHQEAWAKHLGIDVEFTDSIGMKLLLIPPGEFTMGSSMEEINELLKDAEDWERKSIPLEGPQRAVKVGAPFYLGACEVTVGQFKQFIAEKKYKTSAERNGGGQKWIAGKVETRPEYTWRNPADAPSDDHPVIQMSLSDARAFCEWLSEKEGRTYVVPNEEHWEYACRAGTTTPWFSGADKEALPDAAWTMGNTTGQSRPVGTKKANPFGLYDLSGNAEEMCVTADGKAVARGGHAAHGYKHVRSATRFDSSADVSYYLRGFRVALVGDLKVRTNPVEEWTPLFNGADLTGWKTHPRFPGGWEVKERVLSPRGKDSYLFSEGSQYRDFHLRFDAKIDNGAYGQLFVRYPFQFSADGVVLEAHFILIGEDAVRGHKTGSIFGRTSSCVVKKSSVIPGEWFHMEVIVQGSRIEVKVEGETVAVADKVDKRWSEEHLMFMSLEKKADIRLRKMQIKELPPSKAESATPFVIVAKDAKEERKFASLETAVFSAQAGDTIEIQGNGPFFSGPVFLDRKALVIRAGKGYRPVLRLHPDYAEAPTFLSATEPLVLEGLTLERRGSPSHLAEKTPTLVSVYHPKTSALRLLNCQLSATQYCTLVNGHGVKDLELVNCLFLRGSVVWVPRQRGAVMAMDNCAMLEGEIWLGNEKERHTQAQVRLRGCTFLLRRGLEWALFVEPDFDKDAGMKWEIDARESIFDSSARLQRILASYHEEPPSAEEWQRLAKSLLRWKEEGNLFNEGMSLLEFHRPAGGTHVAARTLREFQRFWDLPVSKSLAGQPLFVGGDLRSRGKGLVSPEDFRVAAGSPGKGAGEDGKDLGVEVNRVGPGQAYEDWKGTPSYREWQTKNRKSRGAD